MNFLFEIFGGITSLFIFWRKLKEDYSSEIIFRTFLIIVSAAFLGWMLSRNLFDKWFFWFEFVGAILGLLVSVTRMRMKVYETLEAVVISSLPLVALFFFASSVKASSLTSFIAFLISLLLIFVYYVLDSHYKKFTWYKSGKIGFSGLATLLGFFVIRFILALIGIDVLSFVGKFEVFLSLGVAIVCSLLIIKLSRATE